MKKVFLRQTIFAQCANWQLLVVVCVWNARCMR